MTSEIRSEIRSETELVRSASRCPPRAFAAASIAVAILVAGCAGGGITPIRTAFNRGVYHYSNGNLEEAGAEFRAALEEDEADQRARFNLALTLEDLAALRGREGDAARQAALESQARAEYEEILRRDPGHSRATVNLAAFEIAHGEGARGIERLRSALAERPRDALVSTALAAHLLRDEGGSPEGLEEARELLERALDVDPTDVAANMLLGDVLGRLALRSAGDERTRLANAAREAHARALKRSPGDVATLLALAQIELALGDNAAARVALVKALAIDPDNRRAHRTLARVAEDAGDLEGAVYHLWRTRDLDPDAEAREEYRARLAQLYRRLLSALGEG